MYQTNSVQATVIIKQLHYLIVVLICLGLISCISGNNQSTTNSSTISANLQSSSSSALDIKDQVVYILDDQSDLIYMYYSDRGVLCPVPV